MKVQQFGASGKVLLMPRKSRCAQVEGKGLKYTAGSEQHCFSSRITYAARWLFPQGSLGDAVRGVAYALMNGAYIVNNSWGSPDKTRALQTVIDRARYMRDGLGILVVNAAGNESTNNDIFPFYPAGFDYRHTIA